VPPHSDRSPDEVRQAYRTTFGTEHGQVVLDDLRLVAGDRLSYTRGDPYETAYREGARGLYLRILSMMRDPVEVESERR